MGPQRISELIQQIGNGNVRPINFHWDMDSGRLDGSLVVISGELWVMAPKQGSHIGQQIFPVDDRSPLEETADGWITSSSNGPVRKNRNNF